MQIVPSKKKKPLKLVLLGEGGVGKTTISKSYIDNYFFTKSKQTIAVEFHSKTITHSNNEVSKLQIWDLGGQEHFKQMGCNQAVAEELSKEILIEHGKYHLSKELSELSELSSVENEFYRRISEYLRTHLAGKNIT